MLSTRSCFIVAALPLLFVPLGAKAQTNQQPVPVPTDAELLSWVDTKVKERMPTAEERTFDQVGWAADVREALSLAKKHNRPVFLFTHDGRMNLGRC